MRNFLLCPAAVGSNRPDQGAAGIPTLKNKNQPPELRTSGAPIPTPNPKHRRGDTD